MFKTLLRLLSLVCFAVAMVAGVLDITRSLADSEIVMTPLLVDWQRLSPATISSFEGWVRESLFDVVWDPIALSLLKLPTWAIFAAMALLLGFAARRRRNRWQAKFGA